MIFHLMEDVKNYLKDFFREGFLGGMIFRSGGEGGTPQFR